MQSGPFTDEARAPLPISITLAAGLYLVIWWLVLFAVLPFGVRTQVEADEVTSGTEPAAPLAPRLWTKVLVTTVVAAVVFAVVLYVISAVEL